MSEPWEVKANNEKQQERFKQIWDENLELKCKQQSLKQSLTQAVEKWNKKVITPKFDGMMVDFLARELGLDNP